MMMMMMVLLVGVQLAAAAALDPASARWRDARLQLLAGRPPGSHGQGCLGRLFLGWSGAEISSNSRRATGAEFFGVRCAFPLTAGLPLQSTPDPLHHNSTHLCRTWIPLRRTRSRARNPVLQLWRKQRQGKAPLPCAFLLPLSHRRTCHTPVEHVDALFVHASTFPLGGWAVQRRAC